MIQQRVFPGKAVPKKLPSESPERFVYSSVFAVRIRLFATYKITVQAVEPLKICLSTLEAVFKHTQPASC